MKKDNPIRRLREYVGMNQSDFGRAIGKSMQTVRNYEGGIGQIPPDVIDRIKTLAAEKGFADIALELSSEEWRVRHVIRAGETLISSRKQPGPLDYTADRQMVHALVDAILDSRDEPLIAAFQSMLALCQRNISADHKSLRAGEHKK